MRHVTPHPLDICVNCQDCRNRGRGAPQILADQLTHGRLYLNHGPIIPTILLLAPPALSPHRIFGPSYGPDYSPDWKCWSARVAKGLTIDYIYENRSNINCADH